MVSFPKLTIQLIQSFLSSKEAAQTTLVSKSWRKAWLTRPNLDFDQSDYASIGNFAHFANKTLMRYSLSNKKIHTLNLRMCVLSYCEYLLGKTATSIIARAMKLGATNLSIEIGPRGWGYVLPDEVFGSETLVALWLKGSGLNPNQVIRCSTLESLSLSKCWIHFDVIIRILSSCPLIRSLSLSHISYARYYKEGGYDSSGSNYDEDNYFDGYGYRNYCFDDCYVDGRIKPHAGLRSMVLKYVDYDSLFLFDLSTRFPFLEDLTLHMCTDYYYGQREIRISSPTVERLTFALQKRRFSLSSVLSSVTTTLDVPSIRTFTYEGSGIPRLSFISAPWWGWESRVSITLHVRKQIGTSWFVKLRKFLKKLKRSRISSLDLIVNSKRIVDYEVEAIQGSMPLEIENLTLDFEGMPSLSCYAFLDGLFRICRPKLITANNVISTRSQFMYGLNNLREARAEIFDEDLSVWRDVALDAVLNDSTTTPGDLNRKVRFQLNWPQSSVQVRPEKVCNLEDGDYVWVVLSRKQYCYKVVSRRAGPFKIVEKVNSNAYRLQIPSHVGAPDVIDVEHLVPYTGDHYLSSDEDEPSVNFLDTLEDNVERLAWQFIEKQEHSKHFS